MGVNHRRADVAMSQEFLNGPQVHASLQQMSRATMSQGVGARGRANPCSPESGTNTFLNMVIIEVMAFDSAIAGITVEHTTGEDVLPSPVFLL